MSLLASYIAHAKTVKPTQTAYVYTLAARQFVAFVTKQGWTIEQSPPTALQEFVNSLVSRYAPRSITTKYFGVRDFLGWLAKQGTPVTVHLTCELPRADDPEQVVLDQAQVGRLLAYLQSPPADFPLQACVTIGLMVGSGLRVSEVCALQVGQLYPTAKGGLRLDVLGKGGKRRIVPVMGFARQLLVKWLRATRPRTWLFPSVRGAACHHLVPRAVDAWTLDLSRRLGLYLHPHALRHTYLTLLNEAGVDAFTIRKIAGHSSLKTTALYVHPTAAGMDAAIAKTEDLLCSTKKEP